MSSLQDVLTGPKSKVSYLEADTRSYDPPPLVRPDQRSEATELAKVRLLRKFVPVNVSSATGIVAGFLPSTSPTDAQNINTGSCYGILFIGVPRALLAALWHLASTTTITLVFLWGKARELSPLPFLKLSSTERTGLQHQQATRIMLAPSLQPTLSSAITLLASSCSDMFRSRMAGNLHFTFSTVRRTKFGRTLEH